MWGCSTCNYIYELCKISKAIDPAEVWQFKLVNKPSELEEQLKFVNKVAMTIWDLRQDFHNLYIVNLTFNTKTIYP